jgi:deoxyribonuclease-4
LSKRNIGIHVSIAERVDLAVDRAVELGCVGVFQIFTCSPRRWAAKPLENEQALAFKEKMRRGGFRAVTHMPYMPNLSSPDRSFYSGSVEVLVREINRCDELGIGSLVVHFGSHMGSSIDEGHSKITSACKKAIGDTSNSSVRILLENSASVKNSVGSKFEQICTVLDKIGNEERMGVCFDTCHAFASGYDLRDTESAAHTVQEFDKVVGLERLFLIHVNDSKGKLGEGTDRHEHIGLGNIGSKGFKSFFALKEIKEIPLVLETPIDEKRGDKENLTFTKKLLVES